MKQKLIFLHPYFDYKIWGGNRLKNFGYQGNEKIGEALMISALEGKESIVVNGPFKNLKLSDVFKKNPDLFGWFNESYPLLTKIIDANEDLSVQVHPDDEYALKHFKKLGKTECWYILDCPENAQIIYGTKENNLNKIEDYIKSNNWNQFLKYENVKKNDVIYVPAGTIHAITKGILTYEIQQSSDLTFRLFDYNRIEKDGNPRELHIQDSLNTIKTNLDLKIIPAHDEVIINSNKFTLERKTINGEDVIQNDQAYWLECTVIEGNGLVENELITKGSAFIVTHKSKVKIKGNVQILIGYVKKYN